METLIKETFKPLFINPIYTFALVNIVVFSIIGAQVIGTFVEEVIKSIS